MKVAFIAGMGRSGSTVLDRYLGAQPGFQSLGEVPTVWSDGVLDNNPCSCGDLFRECPFWCGVVAQDPEIFTPDVAHTMANVHRQVLPAQQTPGLWLKATRSRSVSKLPPAYFSVLARFYSAVHSSTGAAVLVDSTKGPAYLNILDQVSSVETFVVHLIRDPRAVAYSWARRKRVLSRSGEDVFMEQYGPIASGIIWVAINFSTGRVLGRRSHHRLRYEDFVLRPDLVAGKIRAGLGVRSLRSQKAGTYHVLGGNPDRFVHGPIHLKSDSEWIKGMPVAHAWATTVMTLPWLLLYGYPVSPRIPAFDSATDRVNP